MISMKLLIYLFLINSILYFVRSESLCYRQKTCGKCIGHALEKCVWCAAEPFTEGFRCQPETYYIANGYRWCEKRSVFNPAFKKEVVENRPFDNQTQLRPQLIKIRARPGIPVNFEMSYQPADQFPLDVYILMDFSYTMKAHKDALEHQVDAIYMALQNMTKNVQIGVGTFVEKPGFPYADVMDGDPTLRQYAYTFKNHLSLTSDMVKFKEVVRDSQKFGSNYEDPECTLDALMQVMACVKDINWRERARRIIVVATDSTYHSAGDGKIIGAVKPNDMKCHLKDNEYEAEAALVYDYPSVSQIDNVAAKGKFIIIFAAVDSVIKVYEDLSRKITGAKFAVLKKDDTDNNIVNIIKNVYLDNKDNVKLDYYPNPEIDLNIGCYNKDSSEECKSTPNDMIVTIPGSIKTVSECKPNEDNKYTIIINQMGIMDKLTIELEVDCECECEKGVVDKSVECNGKGKKVCGVCSCDDKRSGEKCELDCSDDEAMKFYDKCLHQTNATRPCRNRGDCRCGICECMPGFSGDFCQYNDLACEKPNGYICSRNGKCKKEECQCFDGWTGTGCQCPTDPKYCVPAFSNKICSGRGNCECGKCQCHVITGKTNEKYLGAYCNECDNCALERCEELKDYVYCNYLHNKDDCDKQWASSNVTVVTIIKLKKSVFNSTEMDAKLCRGELDDGKILVYKYDTGKDSTMLRIIIQDELELAPKVSLWVVIGSVVGGILLMGIMSLITWKICIDRYDAREYEKFCENARAQGYDVSQNPLYRDPNINIINPTFDFNDH